MTDRELMQQALEALSYCEPDYYENPIGLRLWADVMPVLRERLAQPEQEPFEYWNAVEGWVTVTLNEVLDGRATQRMLHTAMKAVPNWCRDDPEVMFAKGWDAGFNARTCGPSRKEHEPFGYFQYSMHLDAWVQNKEESKGTAFYTSPPRREWLSLTDDERLEVAGIDGADEWFWKVVEALEAKLKEKNT